nr:MAG TPA: Single strand binding protein [Caudoviricetes sp.]
MNSVQLTGRLTAEPQYMDKGQSDITHFTMAVQRSYKNKDGEYDADFVRCTAFGKRASVIADNFHKGSWIEVTGEWRTGSYQDKNETLYTPTNVQLIILALAVVTRKTVAQSQRATTMLI